MVEVLIATAFFAFIAVATLAVFLRAVQNNVSGGDSSQASRFARDQIEELKAVAVDNGRLSLQDPLPEHTVQPATNAGTGDEMLLGDLFWDPGARATVPAGSSRYCNLVVGSTPETIDGDSACIKLGDGGFTTTLAGAKGVVLWQRRGVVRQYTYADISDGVIDQSGAQLVTLGHSQIFDTPLPSSALASVAHFTEQTAELKCRRGGEGAADIEVARLSETTMKLGTCGQRTLLVRTF